MSDKSIDKNKTKSHMALHSRGNTSAHALIRKILTYSSAHEHHFQRCEFDSQWMPHTFVSSFVPITLYLGLRIRWLYPTCRGVTLPLQKTNEQKTKTKKLLSWLWHPTERWHFSPGDQSSVEYHFIARSDLAV